MPFKVAAVGKPRDPHLAALTAKYEERGRRYWDLLVQELKGAGTSGSSAEIVRRKESDRLRAAVPPGSLIVVCDEKGKEFDSTQLAAWMTRERDRSSTVVFLIGGAFGIDDELKKEAHLRLALSRLTLPHELARLLLAEQLYRAGTIMRGEPYHK